MNNLNVWLLAQYNDKIQLTVSMLNWLLHHLRLLLDVCMIF